MLPQPGFWRNLRDLPSSITVSAVVAGFLVVLVGYTGPLLVVIQAADSGHLNAAQTASYVWAVTVGYGVTTIFASLWYRQPITAPWPTAGAALLVTSLGNFTLPQAVGAYIVVAVALVLLGMSGLFGRLMKLVPQPIFMGLLGGVLLHFGVGVFESLPKAPFMVIAMIAVFFVLKRWGFRAPTLGVLITGVLIMLVQRQLQPAIPPNIPQIILPNLSANMVNLTLTVPQFVVPQFDLNAIFSLSLPLFALSLTSQFATGQAVLKSSGYEPPINGILVIIGLFSIFFAFFGGHGLALGALTAAMVTNPEAHPDITKRYSASIMAGVWYILFAMFGATIIALFKTFPPALVTSVAGLALSGTIGSSLTGAMQDPNERDAALVAFLCTAGNFSLLGIGAPFWGLLAGIIVYAILKYRQPPPKLGL